MRRQHYYFVRYGPSTHCVAGKTPITAAYAAFGIVASNILVKDLGTRSPSYMSGKKQTELLMSPGWSEVTPLKRWEHHLTCPSCQYEQVASDNGTGNTICPNCNRPIQLTSESVSQ